MARDYVVQQGDCMASIAYENGFLWQTLWNLPENAALKAKRKNPNVLMTGDVVHIPDLTIQSVPAATDMGHVFVLKSVPEKLHLKLLDYNNQPRPNLDYVIAIDGQLRKGKTDASGMINESILPNAKQAKLTFAAPQYSFASGKLVPAKPKNKTMTLQLGHLNPISELSGLKARLANLGFYKGPIDENLDDKTGQAISAFQSSQGMTVTGAADDATQQKLLGLHGH